MVRVFVNGISMWLTLLDSKGGGRLVSPASTAALEDAIGFEVAEAWWYDGRLVVYRLVPPEWEGLVEDTYIL